MTNEQYDISSLIRILENSQDKKTFFSACEKIVEIGEPAVPILLELLNTDTSLKSTILLIFKAMGRVAEPAVPVLIDIVKREPPKDIRHPEYTLNASAAQALGSIGSLDAVPCLIEALSGENYLSTCAAGALSEIGDKRAVEPLINVLQDKDKFWVPRGAAAVGLGNLGKLAEAAIPALQEALSYNCDQDETWDLRAREAVEDAIQRIKDPSVESKLKGHGYRYEMWGIY